MVLLVQCLKEQSAVLGFVLIAAREEWRPAEIVGFSWESNLWCARFYADVNSSRDSLPFSRTSCFHSRPG